MQVCAPRNCNKRRIAPNQQTAPLSLPDVLNHRISQDYLVWASGLALRCRDGSSVKAPLRRLRVESPALGRSTLRKNRRDARAAVGGTSIILLSPRCSLYASLSIFLVPTAISLHSPSRVLPLRHNHLRPSVPPIDVAHEKEPDDFTVTLHGDVGLHVPCGWLTYIHGLAISRLCNIPESPPPSRYSSLPAISRSHHHIASRLPELKLLTVPDIRFSGYPASKSQNPRVSQVEKHMLS
jgi:hypothetical protein